HCSILSRNRASTEPGAIQTSMYPRSALASWQRVTLRRTSNRQKPSGPGQIWLEVAHRDRPASFSRQLGDFWNQPPRSLDVEATLALVADTGLVCGVKTLHFNLGDAGDPMAYTCAIHSVFDLVRTPRHRPAATRRWSICARSVEHHLMGRKLPVLNE
ncbi:MAG: hypothetical protein OXT07_03630, partial [bacterium]|nr:hypothetical protein [bacterium]